MNIPQTDAPAFFDENQNLWLRIYEKLPAQLFVSNPEFFMVEYDPPGCVFINLTAHISSRVTIKDKPEPKIVIKEED